MKKITSTFGQIIFAIVFASAASVANSQTYSLENPQPWSYQSGITVFSGWACSTDIQILVDGIAYRAAAGTPRSGFPTTLCGGSSNVNFALLRNFNNFGTGLHTAQLVVDGVNAGSPVIFTVTVPVPSAPFVTGLSKTVLVPDFPAAGQTTTLTWQESAQNFAISAVSAPVSTGLQCGEEYWGGTNGIRLYTPTNLFGYQLSTSSANAPDLVTLDWGAAYIGTMEGAYTGSLYARLWAVTSSYSGGSIYGNVLGTFIPNFTGAGAYSSSQLRAGGYSTNTIVSSTSNYNPPAGQYCLVITLEQYMPGMCTPSPDGYCIIDWLQFNDHVTFY